MSAPSETLPRPPLPHDVGEGVTVNGTCEECEKLAASVCPEEGGYRRFVASLLHGTAPVQREPQLLAHFVLWLESSRDFVHFCDRLKNGGIVRVEGGFEFLEPPAGELSLRAPAHHVSDAALRECPCLDEAGFREEIERRRKGDAVGAHAVKDAGNTAGGKAQ